MHIVQSQTLVTHKTVNAWVTSIPNCANWCNLESINPTWRPLKTESTYISAHIQDSDEISKATLTFSGSSNSLGLVWTLSDIGLSGKSKIATITGSTYEITQYLTFYSRQQRNSKGYTQLVMSSISIYRIDIVEKYRLFRFIAIIFILSW